MIDLSLPATLHEDEKEFAELKKVIKRKIGFNCEDYKQSHLKRRLSSRIRETGSRSYKEYTEMLLHDLNEEKLLKEKLTVNFTELFRNPETYKSVRINVLPELIRQKQNNQTIKIWSAGCSNGEEPYSIAIMLYEFLGSGANKYNISILGTDIDDDSLAKAQKAVFQSRHLEKISRDRIKRFFIETDNNYQLIDKIKNMVKLKHHDMISGAKLSGFDIIFCRNVTIYFDEKIQERLYLDFYNALYEGGFFVMGKTETLVGPAGGFFKIIDLKERIYQKKEKL